MNYGYIERAIEKEDYKDTRRTHLGGVGINPSGQWDDYLPPDELQAQYVETQACATFATLNIVEILERYIYGVTQNWSDRFLAETSGTTVYGNDPHAVAETLRKKGDVPESDWPYTSDINTWGKFYQTPPDNLKTFALQFTLKYVFGHQYVTTTQKAMKEALTRSPLGAAVYAWSVPVDGIYHREGSDVHWICIYGYERNNYWKVLDTYDNTKKRLAWDFGFNTVKEYTLHKQVKVDSFWETFLRWFRLALNL